MKTKLKQIADFVVKNKWFFIGFVLVTAFVFSDYLYGLKLSFTNINYNSPPFNSTGTLISGPLLSDIADSHYPSIFRIFYSGEGFSLWDSDIALGRPIDTVAFLMNPMEWVYVLPMGIAIFLKAFSEFALGFFFMYLFMRSLKLGKFSSGISAAVYAFSSVIVFWLGWSHSDVAVWAPLLFYAIEKLISTVNIKYMFLITLAVYVMLIVGMPTYAAYFLYLAGIYIVIFTLKRHWKAKRNIFIIGGMFAVGVILAALASLPYTYTLLSNTVSNGYMGSRGHLAEAKLDFSYLRTFIFPYLRDGLDKFHINESTLYLGIAPIILLPFALFNNKNKKRNIFFVVASIILFVFIFTDGLNFIYSHLPMINTSLKFRVITVLMFTLSVITGISLNDILVNREYYKKKLWIFAIIAAWAAGVMYAASYKLIAAHKNEVTLAVVFALAVILCVLMLTLFKKSRKFICAFLAIFVILDGAAFAKDYLPWISSTAEIIPSPTESVSYMMDNTQNEERIAGVGTWTFFPNTPSYYDLNDIRTHGFEATNSDMKKYYTTIDPDVYITSTRHEFNEIKNYELLKYLGVKYVYGSLSNNRLPVGSDVQPSKSYGEFSSFSTVSQSIELQDNPDSISILFATFDKVPESSGVMHMSLTSDKTNSVVYESDVSVKDIENNAYVSFNFGDIVLESGSYTLSLSFDDLGEDTITVWMKEDGGEVVSDNGQTVSGSMIIYAQYRPEEYDFIGEDSLWINELDEYSDKVELVEKAYSCSSKKEVLSAMADKYIDNAAFFPNEKVEEYDIPLTENESVEVVEYNDSYVKILCTTEHDRYIKLNDYYTDNWVAYVNGEKVDIEKANYLMRAVKISSGEDIVIEFRYEPDSYYVVVGFSLLVILLTAILFIFRKKLQRLVDKIAIDAGGVADDK